MPSKRQNRFKYTSITDRSHRSLHDCLESKSGRRKTSYKNWITVILFVIALHYTYTYFWLSDDLEGEPNALAYRGDELLTTMRQEKLGTIAPNIEVTADHPLKTTQQNAPFLKNGMIYKVLRNKTKRLLSCIRTKYIGNTKYLLNITEVDLSFLNDIYPMVGTGGHYKPSNCTAKHKVAIIVPFRGRQNNLGTFLFNIHPFLMEQKLEYQIFVVEQSGNEIFNKGRLFNAGFKEMKKFDGFQCMVFHDLDLLPTNFEILYSCPTLPRHMCASVNDTEIRKKGMSYKFDSVFGGVVSMTVEMFVRANGYSNLYFGWGAEDNDLFWRLRAAGYPVMRFNKSVGVYFVLPHIRAPVNTFRFHLLVRGLERYEVDGLSNLEYIVDSMDLRPLYTHIKVNVNPRNENITALTAKWTAGDNSY